MAHQAIPVAFSVYPPPTTAMLPPPVPSSAESSSSGSSRKRKRTAGDSAVASSASSTSHFSRRTKQKIVELSGGDVCWHCGGGSPDVAHVISRKDGSFGKHIDYGLLTFDRLGDEQNGLPLCPSCHRAFDDVNNPGFIFLPLDLSYFIDFELKDYQNRIALAQRTDHIPPRIVPSPEMYSEHLKRQGALTPECDGGLYMRYTLRDYFPVNADKSFIPGLGPFKEAGVWHGAPMAAIRRAFQILGDPTIEGLPEDQLEQLWQLRKLYSRRITSATFQRLSEPGAGTTTIADTSPGEVASATTSPAHANSVPVGDVRVTREHPRKSTNSPREDTMCFKRSGRIHQVLKQGSAPSLLRFGSAATAEMNIHRWLTMTNPLP